jgi:hypothetical protein
LEKVILAHIIWNHYDAELWGQVLEYVEPKTKEHVRSFI